MLRNAVVRTTRVAFVVVVSGTAALALWATVPALFGYRPNLVTSDSMRPTVARGDIVLTRPVPVTSLRPGLVVLVDDRTRDRPVLHRVRQVDGELVVTQGDANPTPDQPAVATAQVLGEGRILVPRIGLPALWVREHTAVALVVAATLALGTAGAALAGRRRGLPSPPVAPSGAPVQLVTTSADETALVARRLDGAVRRGEIIDLTVHHDHPGVRSGGAAFAFAWASGPGGADPAAHERGGPC